MSDKLSNQLDILEEINAIIRVSPHPELKAIFREFGFINYKQFEWNPDQFNAPGDESRVQFRYIVEGGGGGEDNNCVQCFFVDTQLSAAVKMFELYHRDNPDKRSYQTNLCINTCEKTKEEVTGLEVELDNTYKDMIAKRQARKSDLSTRMSTLTRELKQKNNLINRKKKESSTRPQELIKEIDKWRKLNKEYEKIKKRDDREIQEEEKEQTAEIYKLYYKIKEMKSVKHDTKLKTLGAQEEHGRKLFEVFLNKYLKKASLRKEVLEINQRIELFISLFKSTKHFLTVDFLKEPFVKVLEVMKQENISETERGKPPTKGVQLPPLLPRGRSSTRSKDRRPGRGSIRSSSIRSSSIRSSRRRGRASDPRRSRNSDPGVRTRHRSRGSLGKVMKDNFMLNK